jgi:hypothetical protein
MERMPVMGAIEYGISRLSTFGSIMALVAAGALLAWVIGLLIVLRGSEPDERSEIIHAYAHCNPLIYLRRNTAPRRGLGICASEGHYNKQRRQNRPREIDVK